ncbi:delta-1-pyrroline-5-carboxylate dehydrogenase, partial [Enterobacter cloacae complex sp.6722794]
YLYRLLSERPENAVCQTLEQQDNYLPMDASARAELLAPFEAFSAWAQKQQTGIEQNVIEQFARLTQAGTSRLLPGPTGEKNTYTLRPRGTILC